MGEQPHPGIPIRKASFLQILKSFLGSGAWICQSGAWICQLGVWNCQLGVWNFKLGVWNRQLCVWNCLLGVWICQLGVQTESEDCGLFWAASAAKSCEKEAVIKSTASATFPEGFASRKAELSSRDQVGC